MRLTTLLPSFVDYLEILGASTSWSTSDLFRPVLGLLYLSYLFILKMLLVLFEQVDEVKPSGKTIGGKDNWYRGYE